MFDRVLSKVMDKYFKSKQIIMETYHAPDGLAKMLYQVVVIYFLENRCSHTQENICLEHSLMFPH